MELRRASSVEDVRDGELILAGGTEVVPLLRSGLVQGQSLVMVGQVVPRGVSATRIGAGAPLAQLECDPEIPEVLREACRLAASPQLRNMGSLAGNLLQSTRCWYWRLNWPCRLHGGDECFARDGEHREHAIYANDFCASAHPSDVAAALLALDATVRTTTRELPLAELYRVPTDDDRRTTTLEHGEVILEVTFDECDQSVYLKAMERSAGRSRSSASRPCAAAARRASRSPGPRRSRGCSRMGSTTRRRCRGTRTRSTSPVHS